MKILFLEHCDCDIRQKMRGNDIVCQQLKFQKLEEIKVQTKNGNLNISLVENLKIN